MPEIWLNIFPVFENILTGKSFYDIGDQYDIQGQRRYQQHQTLFHTHLRYTQNYYHYLHHTTIIFTDTYGVISN